MPFSSSFFLSPVYDVEWWFFLPNGLTSLAAATLFGLWRYDDDIWLYGLCCDGKRDRVLYCNRNLYFGCLAKLASSFFFSFQFLYTTPLFLWLSTLELMLCCSIKIDGKLSLVSLRPALLSELISVWPTCQCHSPSFPSSAYGPQLSGTHQGSLSRAPPLTDLWARAAIPISLLLFSHCLRRSPPSASAAGEENPLHLHLPPRGPRAPEGLAEAGSHGRRRACRRQKVV